MAIETRRSSQQWTHRHFDAAIIDLDGTLIDTLGDFVAVLQLMLRDLPEPFSCYTVQSQVVSHLVGKGSENLISCVLNLANGGGTDNAAAAVFPLAWERYQLHYQAINGQYAKVFDGVINGLEQFKAWGWKLACVTNKPTAFAMDLLQAKGLSGFFDITYGGDAFERKKPDPLPLIKACENLGVTAARALMVGDSSNDAQAARAAGCPVLLVTYGYNHGLPIEAVDADAFTDSLESVF